MKPPIYEPKGAAKEYAIYIHTFPNGKKYVGISSDIKRRFRNGKGYANQPIMMHAIDKYGWSSVSTEIIQNGLSEEDAKKEEIRLISEMNTTDQRYGYNQTLGGEGANGRQVSEENKRRTGERMSKIHKGVPLSENHKKKIADALNGRIPNISDDGRRRIIESNRTRTYSPETRKKMSENTKRGMQDKNMSEYLSKKWNDNKEERKAKLRITMYERYGIVPKKYDLREDIVRFGLDKSKYPELFGNKEMEK